MTSPSHNEADDAPAHWTEAHWILRAKRESLSLVAAGLALGTAAYAHQFGRPMAETDPRNNIDELFPGLLIAALALVFVLQRRFPEESGGRLLAFWRARPIIRGVLLLVMWCLYAWDVLAMPG